VDPGDLTDPVAHTRATYDAIAEVYDARMRTYVIEGWLARALDRVAAVAGAVADLGCGTGWLGSALADRGCQVVGVDLSAGMLRVAAARLPGRVVQGDLRRLPIRDGGVDAVWSVYALLHVPRVDLATALGEVRRVLRPGGLAVLALATGEGEVCEPVSYAPACTRWFVHHGRHGVEAACAAAGLTVEEAVEEPDERRRPLWLTATATCV
jgi:ubiquinone/menaquinone biosynthesis C-methylase UbiE